MRRTYLKAKIILVLDSSLYCYNSQDLHPDEVTARILTSPWMRRLWTLQEGALSQGGSLWIYFKDGPIHVIHFWNSVFLLSEEDLKYRRLLHDTLKDTLPLSIDNYYFPNGTPKLGLLDRAFSHRNTIVPSDEAFCIATLMNLDIDRILGMSGEDRMVQIWDLIKEKNRGELPCRMIFLEGSKIQKGSFRWAPSTLLPSTERFHNVQTRITRWHETPRGNITLDGLFAEYPG